MEQTSCNICGSNKFSGFIDAGKFNLVKCRKCGLVFINPRPSKKVIGKYYPKDTYWSDSADPEKAYKHLYKLIDKSDPGKVFDFGAGTGLFLKGFRKRGWKVEGIEVSKVACDFAENKFKIRLINKSISDFKADKDKYDLVTFNNVLEHLHDPKSALKKANKMLEKNGLLLISVPNIAGFGAYLFKNKWYGIDAPRHLYQFGPRTLSEMLSEAGFEVVKKDFGFWKHDYEILFESFRLKFSPRFNSVRSAGKPDYLQDKRSTASLKKKTAIIVCKLLSAVFATIEPVFQKSEIITVIAIKK